MDQFKPYAKAVVPFVGTLIAVVLQLLITGEFDRAEATTALTGILASVATFVTPNTAPDTVKLAPLTKEDGYSV